MLNRILQRLNGSSEDPAALAEELAALDARMAAARARLADIEQREHQAKLDDADLKVFKGLALEREVVNIEVAKIEVSRPDLRSRLASAQAVAREREADAAESEWIALIGKAADLLEPCDVAFVEARLFWDKHGQVLTRRGHQPPGCALILGEGHGIRWSIARRAAIAQLRDARERRANSPPLRAPAAAIAVKPSLGRRESLQHAVNRLGAPPPIGSLTAARAADDISPLSDGECRARVLRSGYSPRDDAPQCTRGQLIRLPRATAERAAAAGVLQIIEEAATAPASAPSPAEHTTAPDQP